MRVKDAMDHPDPPPEELEAYLDLTSEAIARIVLCLLIEEALRERLAGFRLSSEGGGDSLSAPDVLPAGVERAAR